MKKLFQIILAVAIVGLIYVIYVQISTPIRFDDEMKTKKAQVIETVCQGCGVCTSTCPQGAIQLSHATDNQILAEVNALCQC